MTRPDLSGFSPGGELNLILFAMLAADPTDWHSIAPAIKSALDEYGAQMKPAIGGFLYALLSNNLTDAATRADPYNKMTLVPLVYYVVNFLPGDCHGSEKIVDAWLEGAKKKFQHANRQQPDTYGESVRHALGRDGRRR